MNKKLSIEIKGENHLWHFNFQGDPKYLQEWRDDGLVIDGVYNSIPEFIVNLGLVKVWCFFEDLFNFKNPLTK